MSDNEQPELPNMDFFSPAHIVKALQDSGYKDTAHALAELIDNSVEAEAGNIEVFCVERPQLVNKQTRMRVDQIAVLDDGIGMDPHTLRLACKFGDGTRLNQRRGIGRFGMGLPNSSISQCARMEIWSWQNGHEKAMYTYMDVEEIMAGVREVPAPEHAALPEEFLKHSELLGGTGTLVLWDELRADKVWSTAKTTLNHTELLIGRIHRKFIDRGDVGIRLVTLVEEGGGLSASSRKTLPSDPLYLMAPSSTPEPFDNTAMFQKWGEETFSVTYLEEVHQVTVRTSWALPETNDVDGNRGDAPYGTHARRNMGVSLVRADRELLLDTGWLRGYDPVERWWGVEVNFPPSLDDLFNVTMNKQDATRFREMAKFDLKDVALPGESASETLDFMRQNGDPRALLHPVAEYIREQIRLMNAELAKQNKDKRARKRHEGAEQKREASSAASTSFKSRAKEGHRVAKDDEKASESALKDYQLKLGRSQQRATEIAEAIISLNKRVEFVERPIPDSTVFFSVDNHSQGISYVILNTLHPVHKQLIEVLDLSTDEDAEEDLSEAELTARLENASTTVKLMLAAWARYDLEEPSMQKTLSKVRQEWGSMVAYFLPEEGEDEGTGGGP